MSSNPFSSQDELASKDAQISKYRIQLRTLSIELEVQKSKSSSDRDSLRKISDEHQRFTVEAGEKMANLEHSLKLQSEVHSKSVKDLQDEMQETLFSAHRKEMLIANETIADLKKQVTELSASRPQLIGGDSIWAYGGPLGSLDVTHGGLNVTGWYEKLVTSEKSLHQEKSRRLEVELYLGQVLQVFQFCNRISSEIQ